MNKNSSKSLKTALTKTIPLSEYQAFTYKLPKNQSRLFLYLIENNTASTNDIKNNCSIGNVSCCAIELNTKLRANRDHRRVVHGVQVQINQTNQKILERHWMMIGGAANDS